MNEETKKEFDLSEKIENKIIEQVEILSFPHVHGINFNKENFKKVLREYAQECKKEFIKLLKEACFNNEELQGNNIEVFKEIDKLAGDKLK